MVSRGLHWFRQPADLPISMTYPSGRTVDYTRNVLGQIEEVETTYDATPLTVASSVTYEPFGPLNGLTFGNSLSLAHDFDTQYRLTAQTTGAIQDLGFTHDAAGNIDAIADGVDPGLDQAFTQDALHRIDTDSGAYGAIDYGYDAAGNRLSKAVDSVTQQSLAYTAYSNRLATHNSLAVSIDPAGNTTADAEQALAFAYDDHNRMTGASVSSVLQASYAYNGQGQRAKKVEATGAERTVVFHYGLEGELIGETIYDDGGTKIGERDYVWLDDLPIAQSERTFSGSTITSDTFVYLHADQLNTPRLATDGTGDVVWRWDSDAFGVGEADLDPDSDTNEVSVRLRFPGQYYDEETGLHYNYFRDYDPIIGRYPQSDPIGLLGGLNTFSYALNHPIGFYDPYGLWVPPSLPQWVVDSVAGFGDVLSFGATDWVRDRMGTNAVVDRCSTAYGAGEWTGVGLGIATGATGLARGGLRLELGNWKQGGRWFFREGTRGPHVHFGVGPGLQSHHLPWQAANWARNLWALVKRGEAGQDLRNLATVGYGVAVTVSGLKEGCSCER